MIWHQWVTAQHIGVIQLAYGLLVILKINLYDCQSVKQKFQIHIEIRKQNRNALLNIVYDEINRIKQFRSI